MTKRTKPDTLPARLREGEEANHGTQGDGAMKITTNMGDSIELAAGTTKANAARLLRIENQVNMLVSDVRSYVTAAESDELDAARVACGVRA